jgi:glycosyltransferase involved in cell wall biosynthesis
MKLNSITLTTGIFPPDIGGPASFIPIFADRLIKKGIYVEVITLSDEVINDSNLTYKVVRISRKIKKPFRDFLVIKEIVKSSKKTDLIFCNTLAFESAIASKISGKKLVQKIVGDLAWERANGSGRFKGTLDEYQNSKLCLKSKLTNIYRDFAVKQSDIIITPSNFLKDIVSGWNYKKENIEVIYNAVEFEESDTLIKKDKFRIVSVARLIPHKGIEAILKTLAKLDFDFEYIIIGAGPLRDELEKLSHALKLDTMFIGNVSKKEVANWLKSSDMFILNSSYEGLPHIVIESMENSCPVIASRVGGTPEVVKDNENGLLFEHDNIDQLREKIITIKDDSELREKLIQNGKKFTKEFSDVKKMVDKYIEIIEGRF